MRSSSSSSRASLSGLHPDEERAAEIGRALATPGLVERLTEIDPQMSAVRRIVERLGFTEGALYIVGVSLLSYMLSERGEKHWELAVSYAGIPFGEALLRFAGESRSLAKFREARLRRAKTYVNASPRLRDLLSADEVNLDLFFKRLLEAVGGEKESKTVAFAAKMLYYACRVAGVKVVGGWEVPIPIDFRVSLVSLTSGMIKGWGCSQNLLGLASVLRTNWRRVLVSLWRKAAEEAGTPPLFLDSAVWVAGGCIEDSLRGRRMPGSCAAVLAPGRQELQRALSELWRELEKC
uniref:N-glycosylase/DNA lyase n=1 Tax=Thermofilum pendens TaxID=2269 RepID=A0A7C4B8V2_THEPE